MAIGADCMGHALGHVAISHGFEIVLVHGQGTAKIGSGRRSMWALARCVEGHLLEIFELQLDNETSCLLVDVGEGVHGRIDKYNSNSILSSGSIFGSRPGLGRMGF